MNRYTLLKKLLIFGIIFFCFGINPIYKVSSFFDEKGTWTNKLSMPTERAGHGVVSCNNKIYVIGGYNKSGFLSTVETYDPLSGLWETKTPMPYGRAEFGICAIGNIIYIIGGCHTVTGEFDYIYPGNVLNSVLAYDTLQDSYSFKTSMPTPRVGLGLCVVDDKIYAIGGARLIWNDCCFYLYNASNVNEVYDPKNDSWEILPPMITPRHHVGVAPIGDNIFVCGGNKGDDLWPPEDTVEVYSTSTKTWEISTSIPLKLTGFGIATINDKFLIIGGLGYPMNHVNYVFEYDPLNKQWNNMSSMLTFRYGLGACTINDKIFAIGGAKDGVRTIFSEKNYYLAENEEFTPVHLNISSKPILIITFPKENTKLSGSLTLSGTAFTNTGTIKNVQIKIDSDKWKIVNGTYNWTFDINTETLSDGNHTISARCYDGSRFSETEIINVTVQNIQQTVNKYDTPGFEFIFTFFAIVLILLLKRNNIG